MLSNLLSLYIVGTLNPEIKTDVVMTPEKTAIVQLASKNPQDIFQKTPIKDPSFISPIINAESSIAIDLPSGNVLFEKNAHQRRAVASTTKLMTILIILEENDLQEVAQVSSLAASIEGSQMFLHEGEKITLENLIYGALIHSANDAAYALAEHNSGSINNFLKKMNKKALEIGLMNTHFANPAGLDHPDNYSSAYDLAKLGKYVYQYQFIKDTAIIKNMEVYSLSGNYKHKLTSTNNLLGSYLNIKGLKTGSTAAAGQCLISVAEKEGGNEILTIVLNSPERFTETKILSDWVFRAYSW